MLLLTAKSETTERIEGKYYRQPNTPAYQTMTFGTFTATLNATEPKLFKRIQDLQDAYNGKSRAEQIKFPSQPLVKQETIGSHYEKRHYRGRMINETVKEYKTVYQPCIPGAEWLEKHINDPYPEPTIDLAVDGRTLHLNGNYKPGMIRAFVKDSLKLM